MVPEYIKVILSSLFTICILNIVLYSIIYKSSRNKLTKNILFFWISLLLLFIVEIPIQNPPFLISLVFSLNIFPLLLLTKGIIESLGGRFRTKIYLSLMILAVLFSSLLYHQGYSFKIFSLPIAIGNIAPLLHCLYLIIINAKTTSPIHFALGFTHLAAIYMSINFSINRLDPDAAVWGWSTALLTYIAISSTLPFFTLQEIFKSEKDRLNYLVNIKTRELANLSAILSHDIGNYLQSISSYVYLAQIRNPQEESISRAHEAITDLNSFFFGINQYLKNKREGRLIASEVQNPAKLENSLIQIHERYKPIAESKKINLRLLSTVPQNTVIHIDQNLFSNCIVANIVHNAIKFSPEGSEVTIAAELDEQNRAQISVSDNGQGMSQEKIESIFNDMNQSTVGTTGERGSGLGLYIVKDMVSQYKGSIDIKSRLGEGTSIMLQF